MWSWRRGPRVAVMTMVRDEAVWLPRWVAHYGREVGLRNLLVFDDGTTDGSTTGLPCRVHRMPAGWLGDRSFDAGRTGVLNRRARWLLEKRGYDAVIAVDVDEFLVADPAVHPSLQEFLAARRHLDVVAATGLDVVHHLATEGPLDPAAPITEQRSFAQFTGGMCKPAIKRVAVQWRMAGHGIRAPFTIDPELFLLHTKYADRDLLRVSAERRHARFLADRAGHTSTWTVPPDALVDRLAADVDAIDPARVPVFDPRAVDPASVIEVVGERYRSVGGNRRRLISAPVVRIPPQLRGTV